jgi:tetratricopeptide (TPR) repeat protein
MKKIIFVVLMIFALSAVYDTPFAAENSEHSKALKYYNSKKYKEAVELFKEQVQKNPTPSGYYLLGYSLYKLGKFEEANEYFKEAYLLDPDFSLEKAGLIKKTPEAKAEEAEKPSMEKVSDAEKPSVSETKEKQPEAKKEPAASKEPQPQKPEAAKDAKGKSAPVAAENKPAAQEPKKVEPQKAEPLKPMQPPSKIESLLKFKKEPPFVATEVLIALGAGLGIIVLVIGVVLYRKRRHKSDSLPAG